MSGFPEPRYRAVPPRRAARVRQTLARLGTLAADVARVGTERWTDGMSQVLLESQRELDALGLGRARQAVADVLAVLGLVRGAGGGLAVPGQVAKARATAAPTIANTLAVSAARRAVKSLSAQAAVRPESPVVSGPAAQAQFARSLLKLALLAPAARAYPDGARARVEPLLRATLAPDERPLLKGRVLVPLVERERPMAWDAGLGLVEVSRGTLPAGACALVGRLVCDHRVNPGGVTAGAVRRVTAGVPLGPRVDRRVLRDAEPSLDAVLAAAVHELADPFGGPPAPRLVGPLTHLRADHVLGVDVLADASGKACTAPGPLVPLEGGSQVGLTWWLLATPRARNGMLELVPWLAWCAARGQAPQRVPVDAGGAAPAPAGEPLLDACADALADLQASGLARGLASRAAVRELAGELDAGGWRALGERMRRLPDAPPERGAIALHGALHLVDRLRTGPRGLLDGEIAK